ncbi:hypothetical protein [Bacillus thuringiensis]|uniref:hypothetical protein n=1 Tax=Bacillus thuringiensis TaxID=1428 RepID=UPI000C9E9FB1|nr:hypothetical protein [Bacillus thuringiensis]
MLFCSISYAITINTVNEVSFFFQLLNACYIHQFGKYEVTGRRAEALLNNGIIQSLPSAGFGFYVPSL